MLPADIETLVFNCFYTFLGGPGLLINFGVLFGLFWYTKFKKLREKNLLLICANLTYNGFLCSGYFVLGLLRIIQAAGGNVPYTQIQCVLLQQPIIIGCFSCDLITLMIASDRFFAVYFPLVYRSHGEHVRLYMVAGSGILAVSMAGGSWIGSSNTNLASCASAALMATFRDIWTSGQIICSALAAIIYIFVLVKIRLSRRRVIPKDGAKADAQTERDRKMTVMVTSMIACFMVTTVTANVLRQVYPYAENTYVKTAMSQMVGTLLLINSWVDLVIYTKKNEEIKLSMKKAVGHVCCCIAEKLSLNNLNTTASQMQVTMLKEGSVHLSGVPQTHQLGVSSLPKK